MTLGEKEILVTRIDDKNYDEGSLRAQKEFKTITRCPEVGNDELKFELPTELSHLFKNLSQGGTGDKMTPKQALWIANLDPNIIGHKAHEVYDWFKSIGLIGFVPIDHRILIGYENYQNHGLKP